MGILVAGDLNVDIIIAGLPCLPELGAEQVGTDLGMTPGGSATNMACTLAALGEEVSLAARIGTDVFGDFLIESVARRGVDVSHIERDADHRTGVTAALACGPDRAFATFSGAVRLFSPDDITGDLLDRVRHVHIGGYYLVPLLALGAAGLFRRARDHGCTTSLDVGYAPGEAWAPERVREALEVCDIFLPNEVELHALTGIAEPEQAARGLAAYGATVVAKLGEHGAIAVRPDGAIERCPALDIEPLDTTGCGDAFNAGLLHAWASGQPLIECLRFANACGALCATRLGGSEVISSEAEVLALTGG